MNRSYHEIFKNDSFKQKQSRTLINDLEELGMIMDQFGPADGQTYKPNPKP